jgi:hypothetical protein
MCRPRQDEVAADRNRRWHPRSGLVPRICLALLIWLMGGGAVAADESAQEFWPEVDIWLRLSPAWRASLFVPISKNIETAYREGNLILQADYAWKPSTRVHRTRLMDEGRAQKIKAFMVRGGYLGGRSLGDRGESYTERTVFAELHVRTPLKGGVLLQHRLRSDLRWLGEAPDFSTRYRYRLQAEKEYVAGRTSVVPYANVEAYFDSRYGTVNRFRLIGGASVAWSARFAFEGNWTYQHDSRSSTEYLNALNLILHVYFARGSAP